MHEKTKKNNLIDYLGFVGVIVGAMTFDIREFTTPDCFDDFYQQAYIDYKTFIKELYYLPVVEWLEFFYQEWEIETHHVCLNSKLEGLKNLALKNKKRS